MFRRLLIDGYNLLYRDPAFARERGRNLATAREQLIRKIDRLAPALATRVEMVFDGRAARREQIRNGALHLIYSPSNKTADTVIEQLVHADPAPEEICVVTADRPERETITAANAHAMSCISFLEWLDRLDKQISRPKKQGLPPRFTLGDQFPETPPEREG